MHLALKFYWYLMSFVEDEDPFNIDFCRSLKEDCEMALVNGQGPVGNLESASKDKLERSDYFSRVTSLVEKLMRISNVLRSFPVEERSRELQARLGAAMKEIVAHGGYIPLWSADSSHFTIARLPPGEGVVLNSRDRCPYMLFVEVIRSPLTCSETPNVHMSEAEIEHLVSKMDFEKAVASPMAKERPITRDAEAAIERWVEEESVELASSPLQPQPESWDERKERIRHSSPLSENPKWDVVSVIVKYGDDCRQELLAVQLLSQIKSVFDAAGLPLWVHPHSILVVGRNSALIETIPNVKSIHQHKKAHAKNSSLAAMFQSWFGENRDSERYQRAQRNFVESLAGYSIASYLLQFKDRHNGNLLIDSEGHLIHIDFGYMLGQSPGGISFESAPFKLVPEWIEVMGGLESDLFSYYQALLVKGFSALIKFKDKLVLLVEMMMFPKGAGKQPISCLAGGPSVVAALVSRFDGLGKTEEDIARNVAMMTASSYNSTATRLYDKFQFHSNGIAFE